MQIAYWLIFPEYEYLFQKGEAMKNEKCIIFNILHKSLIPHLLYIIPTHIFYTYLSGDIYRENTMQTKEKTEIQMFKAYWRLFHLRNY